MSSPARELTTDGGSYVALPVRHVRIGWVALAGCLETGSPARRAPLERESGAGLGRSSPVST
jgi:hypothetical protein